MQEHLISLQAVLNHDHLMSLPVVLMQECLMSLPVGCALVWASGLTPCCGSVVASSVTPCCVYVGASGLTPSCVLVGFVFFWTVLPLTQWTFHIYIVYYIYMYLFQIIFTEFWRVFCLCYYLNTLLIVFLSDGVYQTIYCSSCSLMLLDGIFIIYETTTTFELQEE